MKPERPTGYQQQLQELEELIGVDNSPPAPKWPKKQPPPNAILAKPTPPPRRPWIRLTQSDWLLLGFWGFWIAAIVLGPRMFELPWWAKLLCVLGMALCLLYGVANSGRAKLK